MKFFLGRSQYAYLPVLFLFLLLSLSASLVLTSSASAISDFDDYRSTTKLEIYKNGCTTLDVTNDWTKYLPTGVATQYLNPDIYHWGMAQVNVGNTGAKQIIFYSVKKSTAPNPASFYYYTNYQSDESQNHYYGLYLPNFTGASGEFYSQTLGYPTSTGCSEPTVLGDIYGTLTDYGNGMHIRISTIFPKYDSVSGTTITKSLYYNTSPFVSPTGFIGTPPPQNAVPPPIPLKYYVNFKYTNTQKELTATYSNKVTDPVSNLADPKKIWWQLKSENVNSTATMGDTICDIELPVLKAFNTTEHCTFPSAFVPDLTKSYYLLAKVNPAINQHIDTTGYDVKWQDNVYVIDFNKSSFGSTVGCGVGAFQPNQHQICVSPSETSLSYEWLTSLNIPTSGLQDVIIAPLAFIARIESVSCNPLILPMPYAINDITMPCMTPIYQQNFGQIFLIYQTILTGLFAYYVSLKAFGNIKEITNPRDDQIETVKL